MTKMTDADLLSFLDDEARQAHLFNDGELQEERTRAMRAYTREPYGNEEEGRSAVVSSDVFDAVEGMLPDLIEVFTSSDKAVVFEPVGPEDEESAEQVTNACNYVFYKQNNGFLILYTALKDALLLKTGAVKWFWEKKRTPTFNTYRAVDEMQLAEFLAGNPNAEVVEQEEVEPGEEEIAQALMSGLPLSRRFTVKIKTVEEKGKCSIVAIPPEELQVSRRHDSPLLDECPYVCHVTRRSVSDLREMGFDVDASDVRAAVYENVTDYRENNGGRFDDWEDEDTADATMVRGYLRDEYVMCDYDGDGIAERRHIIRLGNRILRNEECGHVPIAAWSPYLMTHAFSGVSVADLVEDFQRIHTTILRQQIDNLYLANNQETVVLTDSQGNPQANIDDLLNRRPGGVIREKIQGAVRPYMERWQGIEAMPMLEQLQSSKENRTGWTRYSQGLDGDSLNKTATGARMIMNASQKRMKLMARIAAECLVAPMFRGIFKTLSDNGMEQLSYRLNGKFVQYDPQGWRDQYDMSINVGIGTGDVEQQSQFLMQIAQSQAAVAGSPYAKQLLSPKQVFNVQARLAENAGFKNPEEFWVDPDTVPEDDSPPPPDPKVEIEKAKLQDSQQKAQAEMQLEMQKQDKELAFKAEQAELDRQFRLQMEQLRLAHGDSIHRAGTAMHNNEGERFL
ncbi:hypothetical protein NAV11_20095 [Pseudomonas songnenensis]|uniref:Portal protein n=1 Tax=Pseudomonas songnenensis TaxID=1176259 RepID=A0ABX9UQU9_9PSED|nr:hypothetical protein [Pseudomonas songnenensis]MCQ4302222.1 hypothetical protein [Pseudomonas songnenensis]RMH95427.1 hypothetical protein EA798_16700 [Pseudomonas songnenensis]